MKTSQLELCSLLLGLILLGACQTNSAIDFRALADQPALPYAVQVTGGAFLSGAEFEAGAPLSSTFFMAGQTTGEAMSLDAFVGALRSARVFVDTQQDASDAQFRERLASLHGSMDLSEPDMRAFLAAARTGGADYLLVVQGLQDAPVVDRGINDRWPATLALWLLVGLGAIIPDHSYETAASLEIELREVQTGELVPGTRQVLVGGPLELSLVSRGSSWWWLKMILIPPFWIGSDDAAVATKVRENASQRLLFSLATYLKDASFRQALSDYEVASARCDPFGAGLRVRVRAKESLSFLRMRAAASTISDAKFDSFERALILSERLEDGLYAYDAVLEPAPSTGRLQILMQTVGGRVVSSTIELGDL